LYQMYAEVEAAGQERVEQLLEEIYLAGNLTNWEVQSAEDWVEIKQQIRENYRAVAEIAAERTKSEGLESAADVAAEDEADEEEKEDAADDTSDNNDEAAAVVLNSTTAEFSTTAEEDSSNSFSAAFSAAVDEEKAALDADDQAAAEPQQTSVRVSAETASEAAKGQRVQEYETYFDEETGMRRLVGGALEIKDA